MSTLGWEAHRTVEIRASRLDSISRRHTLQRYHTTIRASNMQIQCRYKIWPALKEFPGLFHRYLASFTIIAGDSEVVQNFKVALVDGGLPAVGSLDVIQQCVLRNQALDLNHFADFQVGSVFGGIALSGRAVFQQ